VNVKTVFIDVTPSSLVTEYQSFGGTFPIHLQEQGDNTLKVKGMGFFEALVTGCWARHYSTVETKVHLNNPAASLL